MRVADLIVRGLEAQGLTRVYCVPGESYLTLLDALHDSNSIATVICRHESGAGFMAVAEAKMTGKAGCFLVSRGPGATNGSIAVHVAEQDGVPLVVLIGQVSREERGRGAFQEVDYQSFLGCMAKAVFEVSEPAKMGEVLTRAFHIAESGTPGPVIIALPEDVLGETVAAPAPAPYPLTRPRAAEADAQKILTMLAKAKRPLAIAGAALRGPEGAAALARFAARHQVPVALTWKNQDVFDNHSPLYAGHLGFGNPARHKQVLAEADLVIAVGTRLGDVASQNYSFPQAPQPNQPLIHIYGSDGPLGKVFRTDLPVLADPAEMLARLADAPNAEAATRAPWVESIKSFIDGFMAYTPVDAPDGIDFGEVVTALAAEAPKDAILTTDSGNMSTWVHRHWRMSPANTLLGAIGGAMGFGVPAGVAAALRSPQRRVIVFVGDGGVLMTGQELATAVHYGARLTIVISDNGTYGTIRTHQERHFPKRVSGTRLVNPDFTQWGASFGAKAVTIAKGDDVRAKVREALAHDGPSVIHAKSSQEALSAYATLSALRKA